MFSDEFAAAAVSAKKKSDFLGSNPLGYFLASMLAGIFVGISIIFIFTIGGYLEDMPYKKVVMGASFGIALSLVYMAGAELFTGNNLIGTAGVLKKTIRPGSMLKLLAVCYLGNWAGAILLSLIYVQTGLPTGHIGSFFAESAAAKMNLTIVEMFTRAILCNILVCLATWCHIRCKSETARLIMIFWCLFAFITSGYEHSVANMTLLTIGLLAPFDAAVSVGAYFTNLVVVTIGNMVGGIVFITLPYYIISKKNEV